MRSRSSVGGAHPIYYPVLLLACAIVLVPVAWMISTSLKNETELFSDPPLLWPDSPTLGAFVRVFEDYPFADYVTNSLVVVLSATAISLTFSTLAGYGLSRFRFRGRGAFLAFLR